MAKVSLQIPLLARQIPIDDTPHYHLRPLFVQHPIAINRQFNGAVRQLQKEVKDYFKGFVLHRGNAELFFWFLFHPELKYEQHEVDLRISKQFYRGIIGVVTFSLQQKTFVCLPGFNDFIYMVRPGEEKGPALMKQIRKVTQQLLKQYKAEEEDFNVEDYFSQKREFLSEIEVNIHIESGPFKFRDPTKSWFYSLFSEQASFNGAVEIEKVGYDLNNLYPSELRRAYYMDEKVDKVFQLVFGKQNTPLVIVGPEGVGRHTLLHEIVWRYQNRYYQGASSPRERLWHLDPTRVIAGMSIVGMWEKRFEAILDYLRKPEPDAPQQSDKLLVDNPVALLRIGRSAQSNMTLSDVLKPHLEKRQLQLVLIATPEEWKIVQEKDRRFSDLFQVLRLGEPPLPTALRIILQQRRRLELEQNCQVSIQAINQLMTIQRNYLKNKPLPGSIMKLLQQLANKHRSGKVDAPEVRREFKAFSGLQERIFDENQTIQPEEVLDQIRQQLIGQPEAAQTLADVVHLIKAHLTDPGKPISSFLFIGPTGVGKTQAAKVLCQYLTGSEDFLIRFDMNEFIDADAARRLIGDYYQPEGLLTGKVRYRPFGILLLDEIEKAHPKVHDLLLQVLDDGRLTDSLGRTVDFSNTVIFMTSNIGAREVSGQLGYRSSPNEEAAIYLRSVEKHFRPEFVNRIDKIVIFNPLELPHILRIARLQIKELLQRDGFVRRTTILNISQDALEWVARRGFDARMGGRALKRQIERDLTTLSAEQLITSYTDNPIILDILFEEDHLVPQITELSFVQPLEEEVLPALPDEREGRRFYRKLLRQLEEISNEVQEHESHNHPERIVIGTGGGRDLDWLYYDFKSKIVELTEHIRTMLLGFQDKFYTRAPAIPLRLKRGQRLQRRPSSRGERENLRDRLFQEEGLKEIREAYHFASNQFDSLKSEFVDNFLNVAFMKLYARGVLNGQPEKVTLRFQSLITGLGHSEVTFLMDHYKKLFEVMDISHQVNKTAGQIVVEGYSTQSLLSGEPGIHLFYLAHRSPLPIYVSLRRERNSNNRVPKYRVVRIYDGTSTLTDLRTGYSNAVNITAHELKLLLFAGIDPEIRKGLMLGAGSI
jgi:ATP-dependent Clp protease ATP-binding subunit ClpC